MKATRKSNWICLACSSRLCQNEFKIQWIDRNIQTLTIVVKYLLCFFFIRFLCQHQFLFRFLYSSINSLAIGYKCLFVNQVPIHFICKRVEIKNYIQKSKYYFPLYLTLSSAKASAKTKFNEYLTTFCIQMIWCRVAIWSENELDLKNIFLFKFVAMHKK